jgi:TPR repeat protein
MTPRIGAKRSTRRSSVPPIEDRPNLELVARTPKPVDDSLELRNRALARIVDRACAETKANGAALALESDGRVLCCARAGQSAPPLGAELDREAGISGLCMRTGELVRCSHVFTDPRVDSEVARRLGIFSLLAIPLKQDGATIGLLEVFSELPYAFGEPEEAALGQAADKVLEVLSTEPRSAEVWRSVLELACAPEAAEARPETAAEDAQSPVATNEASEVAGPAKSEVDSDSVRNTLMSLMPAAKEEEPAKARPKRHHLLGIAVLAVLAAGALWVSLRSIGVLPKFGATQADQAQSRMDLLRRTAERGEIPAQLELATRYRNGDGVARDDAQAVRWLQEAARLGSADAQYELGNAYADGRGVPRDPINAYACYVLAGANGNSASEEALRFLTPKLTDAQIAKVRMTVGEMYLQGRGTPADNVAAYTWFTLAGVAGSADSQRARQSLASKMSRQQISAADKRASEWLRRHGQPAR